MGETAAKNAGLTVEVPFKAGRMDASRNYQANPYQLVDKAHMLNLTTPEMTALIGGLRVLNVNATDDKIGVLTENEGTLTNDFFVNLTDMKYEWVKTADPLVYQGKVRATGEEAYKA